MNKNKNERRVVLILGVACIVMIIITIVSFWLLMSSLDSRPEPEESIQESVMAAPKAAAIVYEPKYSEKNIFFSVDGSPTADEFVNLRSDPGMSEKYRIGRLPSGTEFVASVMYADGDFYGFPVEALEGVYEVLDDADGIVWMSRYYLHAAAYDYPECQETVEARQKEWITTELTTLTIVGGNPRVRSTPSSADMSNVYGTFPEGTVIKTSTPIVVDCGSYTFYGIRVADVEGALQEIGYGHIWYDADNIVWVSSRYAEVS